MLVKFGHDLLQHLAYCIRLFLFLFFCLCIFGLHNLGTYFPYSGLLCLYCYCYFWYNKLYNKSCVFGTFEIFLISFYLHISSLVIFRCPLTTMHPRYSVGFIFLTIQGGEINNLILKCFIIVSTILMILPSWDVLRTDSTWNQLFSC